MNSVTVYVATLWALAQDAAAEVPPEVAPKAAEPFFPPIALIIIPLVLFYVLLILPEKRKRAEVTKKLSALKKNDRVVTIGGIHGVIVQASAESEEVIIRVDESTGTRLRMNRSAISQIVGSDESGDKTS